MGRKIRLPVTTETAGKCSLGRQLIQKGAVAQWQNICFLIWRSEVRAYPVLIHFSTTPPENSGGADKSAENLGSHAKNFFCSMYEMSQRHPVWAAENHVKPCNSVSINYFTPLDYFYSSMTLTGQRQSHSMQMKGQWESNINVWFRFMYSQKWKCAAWLFWLFPKQNWTLWNVRYNHSWNLVRLSMLWQKSRSHKLAEDCSSYAVFQRNQNMRNSNTYGELFD